MDYKKFVTPSGNKEKNIYSPKVLDNGVIKLIPTGKENWFEYIQSFKESVDIHTILAKCAAGDTSGLSKVQGFYGDATKFPKTNAEILQTVIDGKRNFDKLPIEVKQKFNNSFTQFFATMDTPEWFEKMNIPKKDEVIKEEVKE